MLNFEQFRDADAMQPEEGELLYALVRATKPKVLFETGTHRGLSTCYLAEACKDNGFGYINTADIYDLGAEEHLKAVGLDKFVTCHVKKGVEMSVDKEIDFLFIDGYHEAHEVKAEMDYFFPHLAKHAIVVFHDCDFVSGMVNDAVKHLKTVWIPTKNRMRIYEHSGV